MSDYKRIDHLIREARVQRSAAVGTAIGEFLGDSWLALAGLTRKTVGKAKPAARPAPVARIATAR